MIAMTKPTQLTPIPTTKNKNKAHATGFPFFTELRKNMPIVTAINFSHNFMILIFTQQNYQIFSILFGLEPGGHEPLIAAHVPMKIPDPTRMDDSYNNGLLIINLVAPGRRNTEHHHIASALTLGVIIFELHGNKRLLHLY